MTKVLSGLMAVGQRIQGWRGDWVLSEIAPLSQAGMRSRSPANHTRKKLPNGSEAVIVRASGPDKNDPVRCRRCGHVTRRGALRTDRYLRRSLKGVRHVPAGMCEPDEYVVACPDCGARELFDDMIRCGECLEYPCICTL